MRRGLMTGAAILATLAVAGCTGDDEPTPSPTQSSSGSTSPSAPQGSDQSGIVFKGALPEAAGTATGAIQGQPTTLNIAALAATPKSTKLTFWLTGDADAVAKLGDMRNWANYPVLVDQKAKKRYEPLVYTDAKGVTRCFCTGVSWRLPRAQFRTVDYPPLDPAATSIQVTVDGFPKPVSVPVDRLP